MKMKCANPEGSHFFHLFVVLYIETDVFDTSIEGFCTRSALDTCRNGKAGVLIANNVGCSGRGLQVG